MKQLIIIFIASLYIAVDVMAWNPAGDRMLTPWGENLNPAKVHPEYPRPQMKRGEWLNLNGLWQYAITQKNAAQPKSYDHSLRSQPFRGWGAMSPQTTKYGIAARSVSRPDGKGKGSCSISVLSIGRRRYGSTV